MDNAKQVAGVMVSVNSGTMSPNKLLAQAIQRAMSDAIIKAMAEGIDVNDSSIIKARMMAARQQILDQVQAHREQEAARQKQAAEA